MQKPVIEFDGQSFESFGGFFDIFGRAVSARPELGFTFSTRV